MNNSINRYIDAAILIPSLSRSEVISAVNKCIGYGVYSVCMRPADIELAVKMCKGTKTLVSTVLSFPHGNGTFASKSFEAEEYVNLGVNEIDMVINYGNVKSGLWDLVGKDIEAVSKITKNADVLLKVIFETSQLSIDEIKKTTEIAILAGADYVKTSTGFNGSGATVEAVEVMLKSSSNKIKVKASGGIRDLKTAEMFIKLGCHRLGIGFSSLDAINGELNQENSAGSY
jgi:deoxyribose-phosphate aldolase